MNSKIQELTDIIYNEGVVKGQEEAEKVLAEANRKADEIVNDAKAKADAIIASAKKSAAEISENTTKELKLYASQSLNALKSEVATIFTNKILDDSVSNFVGNKDFFNQFMLNMASDWVKNEDIIISSGDAEELKRFFLSKAKDLLDNGVSIEQVNGLKTRFSISPSDGSYKVNFGSEEFENYFKSFLRSYIVEWFELNIDKAIVETPFAELDNR